MAPRAKAVHVVGRFSGRDDWLPQDANLMQRGPVGHWTGFIPGVTEGDRYEFYVIGEGSAGRKRDPYARELSSAPAFPHSDCIVRDPHSYPWHDQGWRPPPFNDLMLYQLHVGTFRGPTLGHRVATFLGVIDHLDYIVDLGVNAIAPLPIGEFAAPRSRGYGGTDLCSPEMDYTLEGAEVDACLPRVNSRLQRHGKQPLTPALLRVPINQVKALVDLCYLDGVAVIFDLVFNHAGSEVRELDEGLWFFDRAKGPDANDSLYFTDQDWTGPVFAFWRSEVRQCMIDNMVFFLDEYHVYHVDGFRYDEASVIDRMSGDGWRLLQHCTSTGRHRDPSAIHIAEYWGVNPHVVRPASEGGAGFDVTWHDRLRESVRAAIESAAHGRDAHVDLHSIAAALDAGDIPARWRAVNCIESHDEVYHGRESRIACVADPSNPRSWYARSRAHVATGLLLAASGIPMLFMGQEILGDKPWSDNPGFHTETLIWWDGLAQDRAMRDHLRFTRELIRLRLRHPALRGESLHVIGVDEGNRVLAFQRWVPGVGRDVVVVASLNEATLYDYRLGMPRAGLWHEVFNSDVYDGWVNPNVAGNGGSVHAVPEPLHGLPASAALVTPANSILVLSCDHCVESTPPLLAVLHSAGGRREQFC